jgi:uncharacterized Zn finger protein (UPF0148 family)
MEIIGGKVMEVEYMFCPRCGVKHSPGTIYCPTCGIPTVPRGTQNAKPSVAIRPTVAKPSSVELLAEDILNERKRRRSQNIWIVMLSIFICVCLFVIIPLTGLGTLLWGIIQSFK